jgi:hypothetical protein
MTVATQTTKRNHNGNDSATVWSYSPLVIFASTDLVVIHTDATGAETTLSEGTGPTAYAVVPDDGYPGTGSIRYPEDAITPLPIGESLTLKRVLTLEQATDLENQGGYNSETHEVQYDKFVMLDLQQQEEIDRGFKFPASYTGSITVNTNTPAADRYLKINAAGTAMEWATLVDGTLITASSTTPEAVSTTAGSAGASSEYSRGDHVHALTTVVEKNADGGATFTDTDATADVGPEIILDRNSATPAPSDDIGQVSFKGRNDAGTPETIEYASIRANISDETDGTEDGALLFDTIRAGTIAQRMRLDNGVRIGGPDGGDQGAGTINTENGFFLNGSNMLLGQLPISGHDISNNTTDAAHDIDVTAGTCIDETGARFMTLASDITKQIDAAWVVGTNQGGMDSGTVQGNSFYSIWVINRSDTDVTDVIFSSIHRTNPVYPTGYDFCRRIGTLYTDASANIVGTVWNTGNGDIHQETFWDARQVAYDDISSTAGNGQTSVLQIPSGEKFLANLSVKYKF